MTAARFGLTATRMPRTRGWSPWLFPCWDPKNTGHNLTLGIVIYAQEHSTRALRAVP